MSLNDGFNTHFCENCMIVMEASYDMISHLECQITLFTDMYESVSYAGSYAGVVFDVDRTLSCAPGGSRIYGYIWFHAAMPIQQSMQPCWGVRPR